jgi:hypothetical protein
MLTILNLPTFLKRRNDTHDISKPRHHAAAVWGYKHDDVA